MIQKLTLRNKIKQFLKDQNSSIQEDPERAYDDFANMLASAIVDTIQSASITIAPSSIIVATANGPATNPSPIILNQAIS